MKKVLFGALILAITGCASNGNSNQVANAGSEEPVSAQTKSKRNCIKVKATGSRVSRSVCSG